MSNINLFAEIDDEQQPGNRSSQQNNGHHHEQKEDELIIFGYSCKFFRDDFSAKAIERGQSLIPWNGDESVMIDRYDCRGHLSDLTMWDGDLLRAKMVHTEEILTEEEQRIEAECEKERYLSLYKDLDKEALQQEEEWKRFYAEQNTFSQVGYTYDDTSNTKASDNKTTEEPSQTLDDDEYEPFYPSEKLQIPYGMDIPESIKLNAVIEKTASFVSTSGLQMEIVLKTKQANNPQFDFLKYDHYLNPYYRHLIVMIKTGKYRPNLDSNNNSESSVQKKKTTMNGTDQNGGGDDEDEAGGSYLHPLLRGGDSSSSKKVDEPARIPAIPMNIHNTAYGQLIKKYEHLRQREKALKDNEEEKISSPKAEEIKIDEPSHIPSPPPSTNVIPPPPDVKPIIDKLAEYVARNGATFEKSIRTKNDSRFGFLERDHLHYNYYQFKVQLCLQEILRTKYDEDRRRIELEEQQRVHGKGVKLILKSTPPDEPLTPSSCREFNSDNDDDDDDDNDKETNKSNGDNEKCPLLDEQDDNGEFIGPRPPSPEFLEKMRKQERRRDRLRDQLVRDKQEERKRKAEMLVQQLLLKNKTTTTTTTTMTDVSSPASPAVVNPVLVEKLLNVKNERANSSMMVTSSSDHYRHSKHSRSPSRSKYSRRSRSHDRRRRRSSRKRSSTRSKSRSYHHSKRSKTSKSSSSKRKRDDNPRRHRHSSSSSDSLSTSSSSSSSHEKKKKKKSHHDEDEARAIERRKNPQSTKWDQRESSMAKSEVPSIEATLTLSSPLADTSISNSNKTSKPST